MKLQKPIYFINIESFKQRLYLNYGFNPVNLKNKQKSIEQINDKLKDNDIESAYQTQNMVKHPDLILDFSGISYVDTSGVNSLAEVWKLRFIINWT